MSRDTIRLPHDAYRLLQTLRAAGHSAYVVGGCVRDSLLGRLPGDWDICTSARPDVYGIRHFFVLRFWERFFFSIREMENGMVCRWHICMWVRSSLQRCFC